MVTKEEVTEVLKECYDPEIPVNIVDLGLVYDVRISEDSVLVKMTLTAPWCPMAQQIVGDVESKLKKIKGVKSATVELVFEPPWSPEMISAEAKKTLGL